MDRLEHRRVFVDRVDAAGRGIAHAAHHGARLVGQDVAEQVVGQDHVEARGVVDQIDRGGVHMVVVVRDLGVLLAHLVHDALPHVAGVHENVLLVHERHMLAALHGQVERVAHHALHAVRRVDRDLGGHLVLGALADRAAGAAIQAFGTFAHHHKVDLARLGERRGDALVQLGRPQVHILVQREAQLEQQPALQHTRLDARVADRAEQDRVGALDALQVLVGQDLAVAQVALRAQIEVHIGELRRITSRLLQRLLGPRRDFLANAIAGNHGDRVLRLVFTHRTRAYTRRAHGEPMRLISWTALRKTSTWQDAPRYMSSVARITSRHHAFS